MESVFRSGPAQRPIPSLTTGIILLFINGGTLLLRLFKPDLAARVTILTDSAPFSLLFMMLGGLYLLSCLHREVRWRQLHQRLTGGAMLIICGILFCHELGIMSLSPAMDLPSANTLVAFFLAGVAVLLNPSVRSLSHIAFIFLLILMIATIAIFGITLFVLDYQLFFPWGSGGHISLLITIGLLMFAIGFSYKTWWCHRRRALDPVGGITLIASIVLIFSAVLGAGLIYAVAASSLHEETRSYLATLINERSAHIVTKLHRAQELSQLLMDEAQISPAGATAHNLADDYAIRIIGSDGGIVASRNGDWFEHKAVAAITHQQTTIWRGVQGHCQLRTTRQINGLYIETSLPIDLSGILDAGKEQHDTEDLKLCAYLPDGTLHCLGHGPAASSEVPALLAADTRGRFRTGSSTLLYGNDSIQAITPIPEFGLVMYMEKSNQAIFSPLYQRLYLVLPLAMLLLSASVGLIAWRIHPLAKQLHRSELRYRTLVEGAADAITLCDENHRFIEVNPTAEMMFGYPRHELIGMHPAYLMLPEDRADAEQQLQQLRNEGTLINSRRTLRRKDGTLISVEIRSTQIESGMMISVVRDISEQIKAETALKDKERFISSVVDVLAEGVVAHRTDGDIIYTNRSALQLLGHEDPATPPPLNELRWSFIHDDYTPVEAASHPVRQALSGVSQRNATMGLMHPNGSHTWLSVNSAPLWNEQSTTVVGAVVSISDITQKRATEQMLHLHQERLRALSSHLLHVREEEKSAIAREIHDELGSSLTAIKMGIEWIDEKIPTHHHKIKQRIARVTGVTSHAIQATRRLVTQLRPSVLEDLGLWAALEWQIREFAGQHNIVFSQNVQCSHINLPPLAALAVYRVVQEALTNIAKHAQATAVHIECWQSDDTLTITLEDNGVGIDDDVTHSITSYGIRGMYERIIQMNGSLQVLGTPGEGTLIVLTIPHHEPHETPHD